MPGTCVTWLCDYALLVTLLASFCQNQPLSMDLSRRTSSWKKHRAGFESSFNLTLWQRGCSLPLLSSCTTVSWRLGSRQTHPCAPSTQPRPCAKEEPNVLCGPLGAALREVLLAVTGHSDVLPLGIEPCLLLPAVSALSCMATLGRPP